MNLVRPRLALMLGLLSATGAVADAPANHLTSEQRAQLVEQTMQPVPGGLRVDDVVQRALDHSSEVDKADVEVERARVKRRGAGVGFSPRVDFSARYTRLSKVKLPVFDFGGMRSSFPQYLNQYAGEAGITVPLTEILLTSQPRHEGLGELARAAEQQRELALVEVAYQTRLAYFTFLRTQGVYRALSGSVQVLEATSSDVEALVGAGVATRTDLLRTQAALGQARLRALEAQGMVEVSSTRLSRLMGEPVAPGTPLGESILGDRRAAAPQAGDLLERALASRPDVGALRKALEGRDKLTRAERGAAYPQLKAVGNLYYANPNQRIFPQEDRFALTWDAGLALSWSPNDAVVAGVATRHGEADLAVARANLRLLEDSIAVEVAEAAAAHRLATMRTEVATQSLEAARRHYDDQLALLRAGVVTTTDLLEAEEGLLHAELEWVDSYVLVRMADAELMRVTGRTGLEPAAAALGEAEQ